MARELFGERELAELAEAELEAELAEAEMWWSRSWRKRRCGATKVRSRRISCAHGAALRRPRDSLLVA